LRRWVVAQRVADDFAAISSRVNEIEGRRILDSGVVDVIYYSPTLAALIAGDRNRAEHLKDVAEKVSSLWMRAKMGEYRTAAEIAREAAVMLDELEACLPSVPIE
jgi:predicted S18 family serine protease